MSTKEEALRKAMEQKEEVRVQGDTLQQLVEDAVRKAIGGTIGTAEGEAARVYSSDQRRHPEKKISSDEILPRKTGQTLGWYKGINSIAVNIKVKMGEGKKGIILFTSSVAGEGTTTVCSNVARAFSRIDSGEILLLDCNAHHPDIHRLFQTDLSPGVMDVLTGKAAWEEAVRKSNIKNFDILPFGQPIQEPLALLGSEAMEGLLSLLRERYDYIFMDISPVLASAEAELMAAWADAVILVIKAQGTRREVVLRAMERIYRGKELLGAILNQQEFIIPQFLYKRLK